MSEPFGPAKASAFAGQLLAALNNAALCLMQDIKGSSHIHKNITHPICLTSDTLPP